MNTCWLCVIHITSLVRPEEGYVLLSKRVAAVNKQFCATSLKCVGVCVSVYMYIVHLEIFGEFVKQTNPITGLDRP
jgi:hypothetical protein